jgi:hypothetical protein
MAKKYEVVLKDLRQPDSPVLVVASALTTLRGAESIGANFRRAKWSERRPGVYTIDHLALCVAPMQPDVSEPTQGIPDCIDLLEVITVLAQAPRDRFRRLELYDEPYRDAAERLREFAVALEVGGASDTWDQLGKVCQAVLTRMGE